MRIYLAIALGLVTLTGCDIPRDPGETESRIRERGAIRLGIIAGVTPDPESLATLATVARKTGARVVSVRGHGEELLEGLEDDRFDIVLGRFADDSPWATAVHFGTPPGGPPSPPKSMRLTRFAFKNGENGWIDLVEGSAP
ncbi:type 2 periplasmic-binding domain-containing protein [Tsuneonella amylolytica]|uniref:hypothetical protein n=1 Tax=Tsuneonella amylolytica TaxID=2338327 RepID=UPI0013C3F800|nr:hypothetical protein [Tsuneonella amylolytica]